jgi:hypothetical protein
MVSLSSVAGFDSYTVNRNSDGTVSILINYTEDIHNIDITVQLDPAKSGKLALSRQSPTQRAFPIVPTDNEAAFFYDDSTYAQAKLVNILAQVIAACSLFLFFVGIFARKVVGVELMAVVQISFLSLSALPSLNPNFESLTNIWFVNGFNYFHLSPKAHLKDTYSPSPIKGLSLFSRFAENYNFTFLLILLPYLAALVCLILERTLYKQDEKKQKKLSKWAKRLVCETAFNGVMFCGYIIAVSFAL